MITRWAAVLLALVVVIPSLARPANGQYLHETRAALADKRGYGQAAKYLNLGAVPEEDREDAAAVLALVLPHTSRGSVLDHERAIRLPGTDLHRVDIESGGLDWGWRAWCKVAARDPYNLYVDDHGHLQRWENPLVLRADSLIRRVADTTRDAAYYDLLYARVGTPNNKDEFFKIFGIDLKTSAGQSAGVVIDERKSGVAKHSRLWRQDPGVHELNQTFDSLTGAGLADPSQQLLSRNAAGFVGWESGGYDDRARKTELQFDAQEFIVSLFKIDLATGERGICHAYLLTDGQGRRVDSADPRVVEDFSRVLGHSQIVTPGSCMVCHGQGLNGPAENLLRERVKRGPELLANRDRKGASAEGEFIDRFYLSAMGKYVERHNEDFATFVRAACGREPADVTADFQRLIAWYDAPLDLEQAAREVHSWPTELAHAIAWYTHEGKPRPEFGRLSDLAEGATCPRTSWEVEVYGQALLALHAWRKK